MTWLMLTMFFSQADCVILVNLERAQSSAGIGVLKVKFWKTLNYISLVEKFPRIHYPLKKKCAKVFVPAVLVCVLVLVLFQHAYDIFENSNIPLSAEDAEKILSLTWSVFSSIFHSFSIYGRKKLDHWILKNDQQVKVISSKIPNVYYILDNKTKTTFSCCVHVAVAHRSPKTIIGVVEKNTSEDMTKHILKLLIKCKTSCSCIFLVECLWCVWVIMQNVGISVGLAQRACRPPG